MSSYIVPTAVLDDIVCAMTGIEQLHYTGEKADYLACQAEAEIVNHLKLKLYQLNNGAYLYRYKGNHDAIKDQAVALPDTSRYEPSTDLAQQIKSIRCFLYQCSEGQWPQHSTFAKVEKALEGLERHFMNQELSAQGAVYSRTYESVS